MTTVQEFALSAARKYLQSVVFVDDEIYVRVPAQAVKDQATPAAASMQIWRKPVEPEVQKVIEVAKEDVEAAAAAMAAKADGGELYHPKFLVESFAKERMVCALYEPAEDFRTDPDSELFRLCERADVVILDWEFHKEPGTKVLGLIAGLVASAQTTVPHHVRLCAIYTSTQNLKHVAQQVFDHLNGLKLAVKVDGAYVLNAGSSRIVVLGKPTTGRPADQVSDAQVAEADLAERIIREFAKMHEGILPSFALHGLASVRTNTKKILDKFRPEMDGAFLAHRGLVWPADDAFEQIPELLAEEALAVMVDTKIPAGQATAMANNAIDALGVKTVWNDKNGKPTKAGEYPVRLLKEGPAAVRKMVKLDTKAIKKLHQELDAAGTNATERLAALFVARTQYGEARYLEFGTVIRYSVQVKDAAGVERDELRYAVCLMPLCDCVRLDDGKSYSFPFWELKAVAGKGQSKGVVIERPGSEGFIELFSYGKPRDQLWMERFVAGGERMVAATKKGNKFALVGEYRECEWVAQLKPSHAQRIAHDLGTSLARVGVIEAEWVRLKADGAGDE
ncbi:MAG: response regulator receiver domain [Candidatus Devosia phytovorans]|uniref:Response regulator receiver domain n=1 Tax=Candidatus Devosia phytovorans TaxID=3121372 RepID=A0AAJ5VTX5_9HYPH|nr:response regulator receiver domain [Devosia sp.]WEK03870.1 MAG: response regulator receiver domain [Devosia sp.]